ncbi:S-adenosyl-L-methionine-dependent methyltransferase [Aspergillus sclerotioniger CBS 115572]|uniref:S-adenosyl-L-methionine-dependent methyltransferase n=1 Tax=Aspergillus sclerotioniger CBS 115572 TaxID=1450535 RepID=A0A317VQR1_9EURO|nr:S-adenosyl-L-methionine-dependent methyltransferase [Aspergillus sclerotioniger CBS 115572]PWY75248.1 S-adenosyl-L-methionine-dependent methyltransferase [Aspergillus sclerotioniger CBS 115572]
MVPSPSEFDFHIADSLGYSLDHGSAAAFRLNGLFYFWKETFGFNIHPTIAKALQSPSPRIADVATGTAIWLLDLARELPNATLDGLDMTLEKAPAAEWLPANITLREWNMNDEVHADLVGKFDVVHLRLLFIVVENGDPSPTIRKVTRLLKPGGWIQWDELSLVGRQIVTARPGLKTKALESLGWFWEANGRQDWVEQLPDSFEKEGLTKTQITHYRPLQEYFRAEGEVFIMTCEETARTLASKGEVEAARKLFQLVHQGSLETSAGAAHTAIKVVCIGQKPVETVHRAAL